MRKVLFVTLLISVSLCFPHPAFGKKKKRANAETRAPKIQDGRTVSGFQTANECAKCHTDIFRNWLESLHATSFSGPVFQAAYVKAYAETKGQATRLCLDCHAPVAAATGDYDLKNDISKEGVTCDFCHSVAKVDLKAAMPFDLRPGKIKRSALKDVRAQGHEAAYTKDFASSQLCAGCHDFNNRNGVHVALTFEEWKRSSFAKDGTECQNCHMPETAGTTANEGGRNRIHDHSLMKSLNALNETVAVETKSVSRMGDELIVDVMVSNWRAGHSIPTGTPARALVLEVSTLDSSNRAVETRKIVYRGKVLDAGGKELQTATDAFLYGEKVAADNRLAPDESRLETFRFFSRVKDVARVKAQSYFLYQPFVLQQVDKKTPLAESDYQVK